MGHWQYAYLYFGLPVCKNFIQRIPYLKKYYLPFPYSEQGGILKFHKPHFIETFLVLDTDFVGPITKDDWIFQFFYSSRPRSYQSADFLNLLNYQPDRTPDQVIFNIDPTSKKNHMGFEDWVIKYREHLKNRPLADFVAFYLCGAHHKPKNMNDYNDLSK
jgi:hypothetical protein